MARTTCFKATAEEAVCAATAEEAVCAIAWAHSLAGLPLSTEMPLIQTTILGLHKMLAKPTKKKEPMTVKMLQAMVQDANDTGTLVNLHLMTVCPLAFASIYGLMSLFIYVAVT